jgi:hypothetical protein
MKKLLVIALSAVMILSIAAVAMADVTVGGELNYGYNMYKDKTVGDNDFGNEKVTVTAKVSDNFTAFVAFKSDDTNANVGTDEAWGKFTGEWGNVQVGYWGQNVKDTMDILNPIWKGIDKGVLKTGDIKFNEAIKATFNVADGFSVGAYLSRPNEGKDSNGSVYGFIPAYANDTWGVDAYYFTSSEDGYANNPDDSFGVFLQADTIEAVNAFYKLTPAITFYANYTILSPKKGTVTGDKDLKEAYVCAMYDSADVPFYARVEAQVAKEDTYQKKDALGIRVGYKINSAAKIQYENVNTGLLDKDGDKTDTLKLQINF